MADPTQQFNVHQAKTHLSRLLERVEAGEEIVIARHGKPVAKLVPLEKRHPITGIGSLKGQIEILPGFDEIDEEIARSFYEVRDDDPLFQDPQDLEEWPEEE